MSGATRYDKMCHSVVLTMAEFINREAFKKSIEERYCKPCKAEGKDHNGCWCRACWVDDMLDEVECFQPSDVAPVVRCKDCKHSILPSELTQRYGKPGTLTCHNRYAPCNRRNVSGDDFCSYGERRDGA